MEKIKELVKGLLNEALEDIEDARILYETRKSKQVMFFLDQASEKILKAYFIGFIIDFLQFIYRVAEEARAYERFRSMHQLVKEAITKFAIPKHLGHDFDKFLNKFLPKIYEGLYGGEFGSYVNYSIKKGLIPHLKEKRSKIINKLIKEGLKQEQAESLYNFMVELLTYFPGILIDESTRKNICKDINLKGFADIRKPLKDTKEPCLSDTIEFYNLVEKSLDELYKKIERENKENLANIAKVLSDLVNILDLFELRELIKKLEKVLYEYIKGNIVIYMSLPLHYCLCRYYEVSRYPEGEIPDQEFEVIPQVLEVLR